MTDVGRQSIGRFALTMSNGAAALVVLDASSRMVIAYYVGKRDEVSTSAFISQTCDRACSSSHR